MSTTNPKKIGTFWKQATVPDLTDASDSANDSCETQPKNPMRMTNFMLWESRGYSEVPINHGLKKLGSIKPQAIRPTIKQLWPK